MKKIEMSTNTFSGTVTVAVAVGNRVETRLLEDQQTNGQFYL